MSGANMGEPHGSPRYGSLSRAKPYPIPADASVLDLYLWGLLPVRLLGNVSAEQLYPDIRN